MDCTRQSSARWPPVENQCARIRTAYFLPRSGLVQSHLCGTLHNCDNLAFRSEIVVARKHTKFGALRFQEAIAKAVGTLPQFREKEHERIHRFQNATITSELAEAMTSGSIRWDTMPCSKERSIIQEWRKPSHEEIAPRTLWSLEQCFTSILASVQKSNPQRFGATGPGLPTEGSVQICPLRE